MELEDTKGTIKRRKQMGSMIRKNISKAKENIRLWQMYLNGAERDLRSLMRQK